MPSGTVTGQAGPTSFFEWDTIAGTVRFYGTGDIVAETVRQSVKAIDPFISYIDSASLTIEEGITGFVPDLPMQRTWAIFTAVDSLPASWEEIPPFLFLGQDRLTTLTIPEGIRRIGNLAIYLGSMSRLTSLTLPESLEEIGSSAISVSSLSELVIPENVRRIGSGGVQGRIINLVFKSETLTLGTRALWLLNTDNLVLPPGMTTVPEGMMEEAIIGNVVLPDACSTIGARAFQSSRLAHITLPSALEVIGDNAFYGCTLLTEINLGDNLRSIGARAFSNTKITKVYLGRCLETIGKSAFYNCTSLKTVIDHSPYIYLTKGGTDNGEVARYADVILRDREFAVEAHFEGIETPSVFTSFDDVRVVTPPIIITEEGKEGEWILEGTTTGIKPQQFVTIPYDEKKATAGIIQVINFTKSLRDLTATVEFDSNGGRDGPGDITVTVPVGQSRATVTIPSVTPVRDGYLFGGWTLGGLFSFVYPSNTVTVPAGQTVRLLALWKENKLPFSAQGELITPYCGIRIWKSPTVHFNATFYQDASGLAVISKAENRPGSARFTLKNEYDVPGKSLLTSSFSQWSDGSTGPIEAGMYVELLDIRTPTDAVLLMDGVISTITPEGEVVSFEVADLISLAGKSGTYLRRNFRGAGTFEQGFMDMDRQDSRLVKTFTDKTILEAKTLADGEWKSFPTLTKDHWEPRTSKGKVIVEGITASSTELRVRRVKIRWEHYYQQKTNQTNYQQRRLTFNVHVGGDKFTAVDIVNTPKGTVSNNQYKGMREVIVPITYGGPCNGEAVKFTITVDQNFPEGYTYGEHDLFQPVDPNREGTQIREVSVQMDVATEITPSSTVVIENPSSEQLTDPSNRLWVSYISSGASTNTVAIMRDLAASMGWGWESGVSEADAPSLALFRVGGSYLQDYLQKLADVVGNDGRRLSYEVTGMSANLRVGRRWSVKDSPLLTIAYGGDEESVPGAVYFHSCKVGRTFKNRPNTITVRGSISDEPSVQSVTLTIENPASRKHRGFRLDSLASDTNAIGLAGLGQMAYSALTSSELDRWEGTVVIPGIVPVMSEGDIGHAGSGWPIRLVDSRIGLDEVVCVKQADYDYSACVTRITVGNYSSVYSNAVSSANALAVSAMDASSAVADTSLYYKQSVYLVEDSVWSPRTGVKASAYSKSRGWIDLSVPTILRLPKEEGSTEEWALVVINTVADATNNARTDYDLTRIGLPTAGGRKEIPIPSRREPDFFLGQNLTVSVMVRLA